MPVQTPPRPPQQDELDALIEEARRRARRRRLGYAAAVLGLLAAAGGLYAGFGTGGGGDGGAALQGRASSGGGSAPSATRSSAAKRAVYQRRCPGRGLAALPLDQHATAAARSITARRVGTSPQIDVAIRPGTASSVEYLCGSKIANRTLWVLTYDHRFDQGPNPSASLAQHRFAVSRFGDGYHAWYWEH